MSTLTVLSVLLISITSFTFANVGARLERIETNIKSIDLKMHAFSIDIHTLKNEVSNTNKMLELILEIINATSTSYFNENQDIGQHTEHDKPSDQLSKINNMEITVKEEISRVRRAFGVEKYKISQQQKRNNIIFLEFAAKLNDTLTTLNDRHDTKWTLAADSINKSVVSVLGTVRDDIDNQLVLWNQSIHDNLRDHTHTTRASLNVLNHAIGSWNDTILESLHEVDTTVTDLINTSLIQHNNLTKALQTKLISSLTEVKDVVSSIDYSDTLSNIVDSVKSHDAKVEHLLYNHHTHKHDTVRLVNSTSINQGRLEVYINGRWGTVCDDSFNNIDASVACKMLGYSSGIYKDQAYFGEGTLPILMDDVQCTGSEHSIQECPYPKLANYKHYAIRCTHKEDVSVICSP